MFALTRITAALLPFVLLTGIAAAQSGQAANAVFDTTADAKKDIAVALAKASRDHKQVLLMYGGNWCEWCDKLHRAFKDSKITQMLSYEYELVPVDIGKWDKNQDIAKEYESDIKADGVPYLTVLSSEGKPVAHSGTKPLRAGSKIDPSKVWAFLQENKAQPVDAADVLAAAQAKAKKEQKLLFIHLGAPWCGWCHRLEDFLRRPEIEAIMAKDVIPVKIDQDRMKHGKLMAAVVRQGRGGGIPWYVFSDVDMKPVVTSDGPHGNIGCPVKEEEITHFIAMLDKVRKNMTVADIVAIRKALEENAKKILSKR